MQCRRNRKSWMVRCLLIVAPACVLVSVVPWPAGPLCVQAQSAAAEQKPNILFIAVDDLNDWTDTLDGHPQTSTPNLDRLAARGITFTNAHCPAPLCNASRAAMMTGLWPSTTGVYANRQPFRRVRPDAVTLPQHFMAHGYTALGAGKIYHGRYPDPPSWDEYWPSQHQTRPDDPYPEGRPVNGIRGAGHFDWGPVDASTAEMGDAQVADWAARQLQEEYDRPFFLACGIFRPHLPWYVPPRFFQPFAPAARIELPEVLAEDLADVPEMGVRMAHRGVRGNDHREVTEHDQWHAAVRGYLASIHFADAMVGHVLEAMDRSPHADNTIIVLWSDHGWHLGEKEHWRKFTLWERSSRVVLKIVAPGVEPGSRCDAPVNLLDVYPTLCELAGLPPRDELEGRSLLPLLRDPRAEWNRPTLTTHGRGNHALRDRRFRYIRYRDGSEELYDHQTDPNEWHNLAGDPEYNAVKQRLARWLPETDAQDAPRVPQHWWPGKK